MNHALSTIAAIVLLAQPACVQVGPKDEPLHIILDVNIKVQVEEDVESLWDSVEETALEGASVAGGNDEQ